MEQGIENWIPLKLLQKPNDNYCKWLYLQNKKFTEPFFDETILACNQFPINYNLKSSISSTAVLEEYATTINAIKPTAFIFHVSRCGSTLLSQMLSLASQNIVLSEVPFFDALLRKGLMENNMQELLPQLKAAIAIYAQKRNEDEKNLFIKLDSWHIHFYKELRTLYPNTPFFLLYRNPYEVLQSQQKKRGMQSLPNYLEPEIFGFTKQQIENYTLDEYMALVLETYFSSFVNILQTDNNAYALNYHNGMYSLFEKICSVSNLKIDNRDLLNIKNRTTFNAKIPTEKFIETLKTDEAPVFLKNCEKLYTQLKNLNKIN